MNKENKLQASLPKGFKDRWGDELALKNKLVDTIKAVFTSYSFEQLETPEFEKGINVGSFLAEDESNPMSDVFSFTNDAGDIEGVTAGTGLTGGGTSGTVTVNVVGGDGITPLPLFEPQSINPNTPTPASPVSVLYIGGKPIAYPTSNEKIPVNPI